MAKTKAPSEQSCSEPTGRYLPCPRAQDLHPAVLVACHVLRGPKAFHFECGACGTREIVAPKILKAKDKTKTYGLTLEQAIGQNLIPLP